MFYSSNLIQKIEPISINKINSAAVTVNFEKDLWFNKISKEYQWIWTNENLENWNRFDENLVLKQKHKFEALKTLIGIPLNNKNDFVHLFSKILLLISHKKPIRTEHNQLSYELFALVRFFFI